MNYASLIKIPEPFLSSFHLNIDTINVFSIRVMITIVKSRIVGIVL